MAAARISGETFAAGGGASRAAAAPDWLRARFARDAESALDEAWPSFSAHRLTTPAQRWTVVAVIAALVAAAMLDTQTAAMVAFVALALLYAATTAVRLLLYVCGWNGGAFLRVAPETLAAATDSDFPLYSVLVPLFREAHMVPEIVRALGRLDYPRLDIKLILEEDDAETIAAAGAMAHDGRFEILVVPHSRLRTKPRACNYGLAFARGEFVVIFDAEDRPEPDQLKKAALVFRDAPDVACLQARLGFYNADAPSWLAKMFALEYGAWFGIMLPGLARLGVPIPLGGTSNHFRAAALRAVGAWDAHNVTEDADLGLRLARLGYRVAPLDSATYEEAATGIVNWTRQRSRWLKGHMQTTLVHLRRPRQFARAVGWWRYCCCLLFIGGAVANALVSPILWGFAVLWPLEGAEASGWLCNTIFMTSLVLGNGVLTALAILAPIKMRERGLAAWGLTACAYWLLMSLGAYKGLVQLFNGKASFWEKTTHGSARRGSWRVAFFPPMRPAFACAGLAFVLCVLSACAAFANPWLMRPGHGEAVATFRLIRSANGFGAHGHDDGALDLRGEYGLTDTISVVADAEVKGESAITSARPEFVEAGLRVQLLRWDTGVVAFEGEAGTGATRAEGQPFFSSLHGRGEVRALVGQDFPLWGIHSWLAVEGGWRWRAGPPADEIIFDGTFGMQPREDLFVMLQSFGIVSARNPTDGYRSYNFDKLQLSAIYEFVPHLWLQAGALTSVYGDDAGDAGGMAALWWRF